jgi:branched-chain amino acid transport system permease protein
MGVIMGNKAMIAAIMGGFGNMPGAVVGGLILGLAETLGALYISAAYKDVFAFVILIVVLFFKPEGLFGRATVTKV